MSAVRHGAAAGSRRTSASLNFCTDSLPTCPSTSRDCSGTSGEQGRVRVIIHP